MLAVALRLSNAQARRVEVTKEATQDWVDQIGKLAVLRRKFLEECTPGYYNNEGKDPGPVEMLNVGYPAGASLDVDTVSADVDVEGMAGRRLELESVSGQVGVRGAKPGVARVSSVSGSLDLVVTQPRLLLMDEPAAGMGPKERNELMALTKRLVTERGMAVLFTEHSMDVVFAYADRLIVLARGRLIAEGTPAEIRDNPQVQAVYFGTGKTFEKKAHA